MRKNAILLEEKHAQLTLPADRPVFVRADAFLIENVLSNYLSNALHLSLIHIWQVRPFAGCRPGHGAAGPDSRP